MTRVIKKIVGLKRYFALIVNYNKVPKSELLSSNEALKALGAVGYHYKSDIMMMMAVIEYEYGREKNYSDMEIAAVKKTLAEVYRFLSECGQEWEEYVTEQSRRKQDL